jgi:hypothetical protein
MNIRQAARWAERKDCVYRVNRDGQPDWMYAVWRFSDQEAVCVGYYEKCRDYMAAHKGEPLRMDSLDDVLQGMAESDGESGVVPDVREQREWA